MDVLAQVVVIVASLYPRLFPSPYLARCVCLCICVTSGSLSSHDIMIQQYTGSVPLKLRVKEPLEKERLMHLLLGGPSFLATNPDASNTECGPPKRTRIGCMSLVGSHIRHQNGQRIILSHSVSRVL